MEQDHAVSGSHHPAAAPAIRRTASLQNRRRSASLGRIMRALTGIEIFTETDSSFFTVRRVIATKSPVSVIEAERLN